MTDEELARRLHEDCMTGDLEADHFKADELLLQFLRQLGYHQTVLAYEEVQKWYS